MITVTDYMDYFRKLVALCINEEKCRIESDGVEVEVDESNSLNRSITVTRERATIVWLLAV